MARGVCRPQSSHEGQRSGQALVDNVGDQISTLKQARAYKTSIYIKQAKQAATRSHHISISSPALWPETLKTLPSAPTMQTLAFSPPRISYQTLQTNPFPHTSLTSTLTSKSNHPRSALFSSSNVPSCSIPNPPLSPRYGESLVGLWG